jgi:hypothetical protein
MTATAAMVRAYKQVMYIQARGKSQPIDDEEARVEVGVC